MMSEQKKTLKAKLSEAKITRKDGQNSHLSLMASHL